MRKNYIIGLVFAIVLLTGCSSGGNDPQPVVPAERGLAMTFGSQMAGTRATEKTTMAAGDRLGVFAFSQGSKPWDSWTTKTANLMYNQLMTVNSSNGLNYSPTRYWLPDNLYSFFAYYPYTATTTGEVKSTDEGVIITTGADGIGEGSGMGSLIYHTPQSADNQQELMVSDLISDRSITASSTTAPEVNFTLHHVLSALAFKLNLSNLSSDYTVGTIDSVRLTNIVTRGALSSVCNGGVTTRTWSAMGNGDMLATNYDNSKPESKWFMVIPQAFTTDMEIYLYANYTTTANSTAQKIAIHANMVNDLKIESVYPGIKQTYTLTPSASHVLLSADGSEYTLWSGSKALGTSAVSISADKYLVSAMTKKDSKLVVYYTVANTTDSYQIKVNSGYDVTLYDATYAAVSNTTYTYMAEVTLTAEQVAQLKQNSGNTDPLLTISTDKENVVTLTDVTLKP